MTILKRLLLLGLLCWSGLSFPVEISLEQKIGQMLIIGFDGQFINAHSPIAISIAENNLGGIILFDFNSKTKKYGKNIVSKEQVTTLNKQLQHVTQVANRAHHREDLPLLISVDYEGGKVNRLQESYGFPKTVSAKEISTMTAEKANAFANAMANTLKASGFNLDFAPVLDVNVNPDNPVIGQLERSFSEIPEVVADYAHIFSTNFRAQGVQCAYKHFPGHGSSSSDSHLGFVDVTDTWSAQELIPYQQLLAKPQHCGIIMTAHIINRQLDDSGLPATLSRPILTGILRDQLKFDGVVITDDMQMKAIAGNYGLENALTMAINAGADMLIFGNQLTETDQDPKEIIQIIMKKVAEGEISEDRINEAYQRISNFKKNI